MLQVHNFGRLEVIPSAKLNEMQDKAAPVVPFVGYRRGGDIYTKPGSTCIFVSPLELCMTANGVDVGSQPAEFSLDVAGLTNVSSWHYLYAKIVAGVITLAIAQAIGVPDEALVYKFGDTSYRYLGCFPTDAANALLPFYKLGPKYTYRRSQVAASKFKVATLGATAWTTESLDLLVPPHARVAHVMVDLYHTAGPNDSGLRTHGDTTFESARNYIANGGGTMLHRQMHTSLECDVFRQIDIDLSGGTADLYVTGFEERSV